MKNFKFIIFIFLFLFEATISLGQNDSVIAEEAVTGTAYFALVPDRILSFKGDKVAITDDSGKVVVPYNYLVGHYEGVFNWDGDLYAYGTDDFQMMNEDSLMAVYNVNGKLLFDFKYNFIQAVQYKCLEGINHRFLIKENGRYTLQTKEDNPLIDGLQFDEILGYWHKSDIYVVLQNEKVLFIDLCKGSSSYSFNPTGSYRFNDFRHKGKVGLVSCSGKVVLPFEFNELRYYGGHDPTFPTYHDNGQGIADTNGIEIIPAIYGYVERFCSNEIGNDIGHPFLAEKGGYFALLVYSPKEKKFIEKTDFIFKRLDCDYNRDEYQYINRVETKDGKKGVLNQDGTIKWEQ